ncbi:embryonal Fyn-associated substrate [Osmerus eperlanus]|uniref:embryonal Fyn-associated substrate n=1 Tax=Osmerus eperlanus TaxID=29151 RepID=UPI002E0D7B8F
MSLSTVLAKALFDNAAESPEELAFRKGDILMVLDQDQSGGPGWWLCSLHGRQGIAPANRLRLLQTAPPPGTDPRRTPSEDSVYLSPGPPLARGVAATAADAEGVYRSPSSQGEALYQSPAAVPVSRQGELRQVEGGRPRSRSSSGPRPEWDLGVAGRPRSPSLRGRGTDATTLYQTPTPPSPLMASQHRRTPGGLVAVSVSVYVSDREAGTGSENQEENTYLVPREPVPVAGHSEGSYLVSRAAVMPSEDVYQTPTGGADGVVPSLGAPVSGSPALTNGALQVKPAKESPGLYQVPTPVGAGLHRTLQNNGSALGSPSLAEACQQQKVALKPPGGQGVPSTLPATRQTKLGPSPHRGSPLLARQARVPASPNFARKPPPPAPPVRGVTRKDLPQQTPAASTGKPISGSTNQPTPSSPARGRDERRQDGWTKEENFGQVAQSRKAEEFIDHNDGDQVYDTPPSSRWQRPAQAAVLCDDDSIYNTPRTLPPQADQESEVYDVPTITLNLSSDPLQQKPCIVTVFAELEVDEDVYSVPTLPGLPLALGDVSSLSVEESHHSQVYSIPGPGKRSPMTEGNSAGDLGDSSEPDCGIYDVPALTLDVLPSSSSSSSSTRRLSVSSNGSGDIQWRASLSSLVQSVLNSASSMSSRDLATSLAEILSVWKASQFSDPTLSLQQAWARLSDLLPALSACGHASPSEALLSTVQRALEDTTILLQTQSRPRLPSQDSLSRRPLPALPVGDVKPSGMGSRKGSWIQERPLPPTPQPTFPLPPAVPSVMVTVGHDDGDDDPGNEYAGIGMTPIPAPLPVGDSVGYVKLQGKPEPPPDVLVENGHSVRMTEPRVSPSPPLPVSLSLEDSELLSFYSSQSLAHLSCLADSIDLLFSSVQGNQPPRVFVSRGKSLIVTAHKLVFIGDTLSRLLTSPDLRTKVTTSGGRLCQALKTVVVATKGAAQNYPSVSATQEMVDRVAELSQHAAGFSGLLQRLAQIS